jgi:N-acyl-D-amino-acid deacylase
VLDILFRGARIVDGTGCPWYRGDVGVLDGRIAAVGNLSGESAKEVVDVCDKVLSPGFIDIHTHSDFVVFRDPVMLPKLCQGVTSQLVSLCGQSAAPVNEKYLPLLKSYLGFVMAGTEVPWNWKTFDEYLGELEKIPLALNMGTCLGHGTLRCAVMGFEARKATDREMEEMKTLARESMNAGAFGLTSGLIYPPGVYAPEEELWELAGILRETGGVYFTHMRGESKGLLDSVSETIELARRAKVPVQISHHKALGRENWGLVKQSLKMVDRARGEGLDVTIDQYPYTYCSTSVRACLPSWAQADGVAAIRERLSDPETRKKIADEIRESLDMSKPCEWENMLRNCGGAEGALVVYCPDTPQWEGKNLQEIANDMKTDPIEAAFRIVERNDGNDLACYAAICGDDIETVLVHPATMVGSDSIPAAPGAKAHPRSYGTNPRVIATYVRDKKVLSLESAIHKMTGMPAARLGLQTKGLIRAGMDADLLVFDPEAVRDEATYEEPTLLATGIDLVYVNGRKTAENGVYTGAKAGRVLRKGR